MDTPPVTGRKNFLNSVNKSSLTPCRRLGLGRPSSSSLKKTRPQLVRTLSSSAEKPKDILPENESNRTEVTCCENGLKVPLRDSNNDFKRIEVRARRCLTKNPADSSPSLLNNKSSKLLEQCNKDITSPCNTSKKRKLHKDIITKYNCDNGSKSIKKGLKSNISETPPDILPKIDNEVTAEILEKLVLSIKEKKKRLEQLKVQQTYAKKHNPEELRQQTGKWRSAGQEALRYSLSLAKQAGYSVTLKELMSQHGFPPHLMGYNSDDDEFD